MSEAKRVLHYVSIMNRAGQESLIMNIFRSIDKEKLLFDFLVVEEKKGDFDDEINSMNGKIILANLPSRIPLLKRFINAYHLYKQLKDISEEYEAFHIHTQHAMVAYLDSLSALKAGFKKVIVHSHNTNTDFHRVFHFLFKPLLNMLSIHRFACSKLAGERMFGKKKDFTIIKNGINTESFAYDDLKRKNMRDSLKISDDCLVVGHVGRFMDVKNHEYIVKVFDELLKINKNSKLILVGSGENLKKIKEEVNVLNINSDVMFLGTRDDVSDLMQAFDCFIFPSLYEGLPVVLIEAQCSGLNCFISENNPKEADLCNLIHRLNIYEDPRIRANELNNRYKVDRKKYREIVKSSGYDIKETAERLTNFYLDEDI